MTETTLSAGTLSSAHPWDVRTLQVHSSALVHFDLSAGPGVVMAVSTAATGGARAQTVFALPNGAGADSGDVFLVPGLYTVVVASADPAPARTYSLQATVRTRPIGVNPPNPTIQPVSPTSGSKNPAIVSPTTPVLTTTNPSGGPTSG
jgi:hypothetical protein